MLGKSFYRRDVVDVAKDLLGCYLVRELNGERLVGKIVEVEAYCGEDDPACHAFGGKTDRNEVMYGEAGRAYVYLIYGIHELLNFVTGGVGEPQAVLVRALEPVKGVEFMEKNRGCSNGLTDGPGKLTEAMNIGLRHNGMDLTERNSGFFVKKKKEGERFYYDRSPRIGVDDDSLLRFFIEDNDFVSG